MEALFFVNSLMLTRLTFVFRDTPLSRRALITMGLVQLLFGGLLIEAGPGLGVLSLIIVFGLLCSERVLPAAWLNEARLIGLTVVILAAVFMPGGLSASALLTACLATLNIADPTPGLWYVFGFLLLANEINLVIRSLFHRTGLEPMLARSEADGVLEAASTGGDDSGLRDTDEVADVDAQSDQGHLDQAEYNAGRIIGMLERWLMYTVLVSSDNFSVIAVIIAAKGVARFRQLEQRAFAEYVLVGTLASTLLTLLVVRLVVTQVG